MKKYILCGIITLLYFGMLADITIISGFLMCALFATTLFELQFHLESNEKIQIDIFVLVETVLLFALSRKFIALQKGAVVYAVIVISAIFEGLLAICRKWDSKGKEVIVTVLFVLSPIALLLMNPLVIMWQDTEWGTFVIFLLITIWACRFRMERLQGEYGAIGNLIKIAYAIPETLVWLVYLGYTALVVYITYPFNGFDFTINQLYWLVPFCLLVRTDVKAVIYITNQKRNA